MSKHLPPKVTDEFFGTWNHIFDHFREMSKCDQEWGAIITLDKGCFKIGEHLLSLGSWNEDKTDLKVLVNRIAADKASRFIFAHNHPNGVRKFSIPDVRSTIAMSYVSNIIEVDFMDHILFPYGNEPLSMKKEYPNVFTRDWIEIFEKSISRFLPKK